MRFRALQQLRAPVASFSNLTTVRRLCASTQQSSVQSASNTISSSSSSPPSENETASGEHGQQPQGPEAAQPAEDPGMAAAADAFEGSEKNLKGLWTAVKIALKGAILVGTVGAAYATYAFTPEQVEEKISALRHRQETMSNQDDSLLQKIQGVAYSTAAQGVASVAELYLETRKAVENQINGFAAPPSDKLLPDLIPQEQHVFTIVLDLNETLVYSDWKRDRGWRTFKRPGVEAFLEHLAQYYELVLYTDQPSYIVDPMLEKLDKKGCIRYRLAREATQYVNGNHYRDLSKLNRNPARVIYVSAHPKESCLQPENAVPVKPWKLENDDTNLLDLLPFFEYVARNRPADIRTVLASYSGHDIPSEFRIRTKDYQRKMQELRFQNPFFKGSRSSQS